MLVYLTLNQYFLLKYKQFFVVIQTKELSVVLQSAGEAVKQWSMYCDVPIYFMLEYLSAFATLLDKEQYAITSMSLCNVFIYLHQDFNMAIFYFWLKFAVLIGLCKSCCMLFINRNYMLCWYWMMGFGFRKFWFNLLVSFNIDSSTFQSYFHVWTVLTINSYILSLKTA